MSCDEKPPRNSSTFCVVNLGCKVNRVEADSLAATFISNGMSSAPEEAADLIIVNTCTVTGEADRKARKAVRHALAVNSVADVIVTGCAAAIAPDVFMMMGPRVRVVGKAEIGSMFGKGQKPSLLRVGEGFRTRVGIKVQDGCDHACTYCIVHVARGKARSVSADTVLAEARSYFEAGVKEVVLAGIDIGAYDDAGLKLPELATMLVEESAKACKPDELPARIRVSSIEPLNVDETLINVLAEHEGRVCRHLHLPLQSGSSKVLREMDRPYSAERFIDLVGRLRRRVPEISLSTDVIVGFPGETEEDFAQTCALVKEAGFSRLHVFPYSQRAGTPAAERLDQVSSDVKRRRAATLRAIGRNLAKADFERRAGTMELCLVEGEHALTESYHEVMSPVMAKLGSLVPVVL